MRLKLGGKKRREQKAIVKNTIISQLDCEQGWAQPGLYNVESVWIWYKYFVKNNEGVVTELYSVKLYLRTYQVCAFGKLSVESMSTRWIVNNLGPIAPVEPAILW